MADTKRLIEQFRHWGEEAYKNSRDIGRAYFRCADALEAACAPVQRHSEAVLPPPPPPEDKVPEPPAQAPPLARGEIDTPKGVF